MREHFRSTLHSQKNVCCSYTTVWPVNVSVYIYRVSLNKLYNITSWLIYTTLQVPLGYTMTINENKKENESC